MTQNVNSDIGNSDHLTRHAQNHEAEHKHDHDHDHEEIDPIVSSDLNSQEAIVSEANASFDPNIGKTVELCAEQGWRVNFYFKDGTTFIGGFITSGDFEKGAVVTERMGERHLKPRLIFFRDLESVEADWTGK